MRLAPFLSYGSLVWLAAIVAAPLLVTSGTAAAVLAGVVVYKAASVVCHQIPERSFYLSAWPLAVCARCFGLYVGAAAASIAMIVVGARVRYLPGPGSRANALLVIAAFPTAASWFVERIGLWAGTNAVRFVAAVPLGLAAAWVVLAAIRAERADTID